MTSSEMTAAEMSTSDLIITAAANRPTWVRVRDHGLTVLMWLAFAWLMQDFLAFGRDAFAWMLRDGSRPDALRPLLPILGTLLIYLLAMLMNGVTLAGWALYNRLRFRGKERRRSVPPLLAEELAQTYGVHPEEVTLWMTARVATVHHGADGRVERVDVKSRMGQGA